MRFPTLNRLLRESADDRLGQYGTNISTAELFGREKHELAYIVNALEVDLDPAHTTVEWVPIDQLHPVQDDVYVDRVKQILRREKISDDHPFVINYKGDLVLVDGHHRVAAAMMENQTQIKARVVYISNIEMNDDGEPEITYGR